MGIGNISLYDDILEEDFFEASTGEIVKNLAELLEILKKMKNDDFSLHVTKNRNDFAEWVLEAYNDQRLTQKLLRVRDKQKTIKIIESALEEVKKIPQIEIPKSKKDALRDIGKVSYEM